MKYTISENENSVDIVMTGKFTINDHEDFRGFLENTSMAGKQTLRLNLAAIEFIDSAGIGMLLYANKQAATQPWKLVIQSPQGQVLKMIQLGRLHEVLTVTD
jgi:anti-anti-sigma factor